MQKKILFCASTARHIKNFHLPYIKALSEKGFSVSVLSDSSEKLPYADEAFALTFSKSFLSSNNLRAVFAARALLKREHFDLISVHTALAAAVVRAALLLLPKKGRPAVINTCHGYLFSENTGIGRWKYILPERLCSKVTDLTLVMNREDERLAKRYGLFGKRLCFIDGMGVDFSRLGLKNESAARTLWRSRLNALENERLFLYAAEFSRRKNQQELIRAFAAKKQELSSARLVLAGDGALLEDCKRLAKSLMVEERVVFAGYISDMPALFAACDAVVSSSLSEGLPFFVMEAAASGLPLLLSDIKGQREIAEKAFAAMLYKTEAELQEGLVSLLKMPRGQNSAKDMSCYRLEKVLPNIIRLYDEALSGKRR